MLDNDAPEHKKLMEVGILDMTPLWNYESAEIFFDKIGDDAREYYSHHADFRLIGDMTFPFCLALFMGFLVKARFCR